MTISGKCQVCNTVASRYKCPKCTITYCSLPCFKIHKQDSCLQSPKKIIQEIRKYPPPSESNHSDADNHNLVEISALKVLSDSEKMREILKNPYLRDMLENLDKDPDHSLFENCMVEPEFVQFADTCLSILHPSSPF